MGFRWHIIEISKTEFKKRIITLPSSTRAELAAIATAILTAPTNSRVSICSDSQAAIHGIEKARKDPKHLRILKTTT
jgi:ribonuclease HI